MLNPEEQLIYNLNLTNLIRWTDGVRGFSIYYTFFLSECQSFSADLK